MCNLCAQLPFFNSIKFPPARLKSVTLPTSCTNDKIQSNFKHRKLFTEKVVIQKTIVKLQKTRLSIKIT